MQASVQKIIMCSQSHNLLHILIHINKHAEFYMIWKDEQTIYFVNPAEKLNDWTLLKQKPEYFLFFLQFQGLLGEPGPAGRDGEKGQKVNKPEPDLSSQVFHCRLPGTKSNLYVLDEHAYINQIKELVLHSEVFFLYRFAPCGPRVTTIQ